MPKISWERSKDSHDRTKEQPRHEKDNEIPPKAFGCVN